MIQFACTTRLPAPLRDADLLRISQLLSRGLKIRGSVEIALRFVSLNEIHRLNLDFRKKDRPTDVLSFSLAEDVSSLKSPDKSLPVMWGDLVICAAYAKAEAKKRGIDPREELVRLVIHGVMHLAGYDHERLEDEQKMFPLQERWVKQTLI